MKFTRFILRISLLCISGLILFGCFVILPAMANEAAFNFPEVAYLKWPVLLGLYATTIPFFYAIYEAFQLIKAFGQQTPPKPFILSSLRAIQICALTIFTLYVIGFGLLMLSNALPPLVAVLGFGILCTTLFIYAIASYIRQLVPKYIPASIC